MTRSNLALVVAGTLGVAWIAHHHHAAVVRQHQAAQLRDQQLADFVAFRWVHEWRNDHPGPCAKVLPALRKDIGGSVRFACVGDRVQVAGSGEDRAWGTDDDVSSP